MIDTIVLVLPRSAFHITEPERFSPSAMWVLNTPHSDGFISKQNPTKKELQKGVYKPRLTLARWFSHHSRREVMLKVELSLPKLMFGNNFDELRYKDFSRVVTKLEEVLRTMGVEASYEELSQAPLYGVHYSKNIQLTDGSTPYHFINKIKEANVQLSLDINQTDYRNDGHSYKWHSNSYEVIFYDKFRDLEKAMQSEKRAIEKDNCVQLELFKSIRKKTMLRRRVLRSSKSEVGGFAGQRKKLEILRMEVRLNKRQKIKTLFTKLGIKADLTFKKLFKPAISKRILLHYFDSIERARPAVLDYKTKDDKAFLIDLIMNNKNMSAKQIVQTYGLKKILEIVTLRELRSLLGTKRRNWYRLMEDAKEVQLPKEQGALQVVRRHIERFKALKLSRRKE